jgi:DNA polymerase I
LREFASLEEIYDGLERVASIPIRGAAKLAAKLAEHREAAFLARRLTTIACDMPMDVKPDELRRRKPDIAALEAFYDRARFGAMLRKQAQRIADRA